MLSKINNIMSKNSNSRLFSTFKIKQPVPHRALTPLQLFCQKNFYLTAAIGTKGPEFEVFGGDLKSRNEKLKKIYQVGQMDTKSNEYMDILKTGKIWEDFYIPFCLEKEKEWEMNNIELLKSIDVASKRLVNENTISNGFKTAISHQSVKIEGYSLPFGDSELIYKSIQPLFANLDIEMPSIDEVTKNFIHEHPEFKNNIEDIEFFCTNVFAQEYVLKMDDIDENDIKFLHKIIIPRSQDLHLSINGVKINNEPGEFRGRPIMARGFYLTTYPYQQEVPILLSKLIEMANSEQKKPTIHPVVFALKFYAVFLHIHPFSDGNGRIGRLLLLNLLKKSGHLPPIFPKLDRNTYINNLFLIGHGKPDSYLRSLVDVMAENLFELENEQNQTTFRL